MSRIKDELEEIKRWNDKELLETQCGCTIKTPHSHLVAGHNCECEKGELGISLSEGRNLNNPYGRNYPLGYVPE